MSRRHLINAPDEVVPEALAGFALSYPDLVRYDDEAALVVRRKLTPGKVGLV
jgi:phosphoenolpyruvate---glycerone phosphotransferase subunit DhaK